VPCRSDVLGPGPRRARNVQAAQPEEICNTMRDTDGAPRPNETGEAAATPDEARMRLALEQLGTRSSLARDGVGSRANGAAAPHAAARPRKRFVRDGDVPVVRVAGLARGAVVPQHALAEERAARQHAEEALADAQGTIGRLQVARSRAEQALLAAQAAVEERDGVVTGLRADLVRAAQREAALVEAARVEAKKAQTGTKPTAAPSGEPKPVRWWLDHAKVPRS